MTEEEFNAVIESEDVETLRRAADELEKEIIGIQGQTTEAILNQAAKFRPKWFTSANYALKVKKLQLKQLNRAISALNHKARVQKQQAHVRRHDIQNHLFYLKLKELMTPTDLTAFMVECDRIMDGEEAADDDIDNEL